MKTIKLREWLFLKENDINAWQKDYNDNSWDSVFVPHDWSVNYDFNRNASSGTGYLDGGIAWYRTHIKIEKDKIRKNQAVFLYFEGIYKKSEIWVNGYHLWTHASGYSTFKIDIRDIIDLSNDDEVVIAVKVNRSEISDSRWYTGSGIIRPVYLIVYDEVYIDKQETIIETKKIIDHTVEANIKTKIINNNNFSEKVSLKIKIVNKHDKVIYESNEDQLLIEANDNFYFSKSLLIRDVKKWSPECPELYKVKLEIITIDRISSCEIITGFRTISFSSQTGFQLNDKNVKLKGVCLHEDSGVLGTAVPGIVWVRRLIKLKELGCNAIRMSHNPHSTILYELCDLMGFLVIDEAFDEWENTKNKWWQGHNVYPPKYEGYASDFPNWHEYDLKDMIVRNRNRPSIIAWSIGNEIDYPNDPYANPLFEFMTGNNDASKPEQERIYNPTRPNTIRLTQIAKKLHNIVKKYDTTRPTTLAAAFPELSAQTGLTQVVDIIGYNYKEEYYEEHHAQFPDLPLFGSENGHGYNQWQIVAKSKYIFGQFLWTGIDYLGEAHGWPIHGSGAGLLTLAGYEKNKYFARKSWWSTTPMIRLYSSPINKKEDSYSRNWNYEFGTSVCIKCYTNSNSPELFLGQTKIDLIYNKFEGCFETEISYTGENLTAKIDGAEDVLEQVGAPAKIKAEFWDDEEISCLSGNFGVSLDKDVKQLEVYLLDQNDRQTLEERMIEVLGNNIELLGIENGNLSDVQSYRDNSRRTFEGKLIIFIRKTAKESEIVLRSKYLPDLHLDF